MNLRSVLWFTLIGGALWAGWQRFEHRPVHPSDGAVAPDDPLQTEAHDSAPLRHGRWLLTPRADYDITARILAREDYRFDALADLVPEDLALGWGPMSDNRGARALRYLAGGAFLYLAAARRPADRARDRHQPQRQYAPYPRHDQVRSELTRLRVGEVVHLTGQLVDARRDDGASIHTSLTRAGLGPGCLRGSFGRDGRGALERTAHARPLQPLKFSHALEQPLDFIRGGIRRAPGPHKALLFPTVDARDGAGVEVPVRDEHAARGERGGDGLRGMPGERERQGCGTCASRRRPVEPHAPDCGKAVPEFGEQFPGTFIQGRRHLRQPRAPRLLPAGERSQKLDRGAGTHDAFMIERSGLETLRCGVARRGELRRVKLLDQLAPAPQHPHVRPVELVGRAGEEVTPPGAHVRHVVGGIVHPVHEYDRARGVRQCREPRDVVDGTECVGGRAEREQPHLAAKLARRVLLVEPPVLAGAS